MIFVIQAYNEISQMDGRLADVCTLELIAETEQEAIGRSKKLIKKNHYRVSNIIEKPND